MSLSKLLYLLTWLDPALEPGFWSPHLSTSVLSFSTENWYIFHPSSSCREDVLSCLCLLHVHPTSRLNLPQGINSLMNQEPGGYFGKSLGFNSGPWWSLLNPRTDPLVCSPSSPPNWAFRASIAEHLLFFSTNWLGYCLLLLIFQWPFSPGRHEKVAWVHSDQDSLGQTEK